MFFFSLLRCYLQILCWQKQLRDPLNIVQEKTWPLTQTLNANIEDEHFWKWGQEKPKKINFSLSKCQLFENILWMEVTICLRWTVAENLFSNVCRVSWILFDQNILKSSQCLILKLVGVFDQLLLSCQNKSHPVSVFPPVRIVLDSFSLFLLKQKMIGVSFGCWAHTSNSSNNSKTPSLVENSGGRVCIDVFPKIVSRGYDIEKHSKGGPLFLGFIGFLLEKYLNIFMEGSVLGPTSLTLPPLGCIYVHLNVIKELAAAAATFRLQMKKIDFAKPIQFPISNF